MEHNILVNEIGYQTGDVKKAVYRGEKKDSFSLIDVTTRKSVYEGKILDGEGIKNPSAGETNYGIDFSDFNVEGKYYLQIGEEKSVSFEIKKDIYKELVVSLLRFFYLQRCGIELPEKLAGKFAHPSCHDTKARIYGTDEFIDVNGGWHDAGDYGRYITPAAVTIQALLYAIEEDPKILDLNLNIPESGQALPDVLAEIKYELDWMLKMQRADGQVYHKVTCAGFCDFFMPEFETEELIVCPPSVTATANFASSLSKAYTVYKKYDEAYANTLAEAAKKAYGAIRTIDPYVDFKNPEGIVTGEYGDPYIEDESYWASAEMYKTFGDEQYKEDFEKYVNKEVWHGYGWEDVGSFGNLAYLLTDESKIDSTLLDKIKKAMVEKADKLLAIAQKDGYGISFLPEDYIWGSNMYVLENGSHLFDAYKITGDKKYLDAAREHINYCLGKNPMDVCYVTGFGENSVYNPHHRPSAAAGEAMEGMLSGGPNYQLLDPTAKKKCEGMPAAKCFADELLSYSTNEVTIYWNSAMLMLIGQVYGNI